LFPEITGGLRVFLYFSQQDPELFVYIFPVADMKNMDEIFLLIEVV